jgi:spore coat protein U-like protein
LSFGAIDPAGTVDASANSNVVVRCTGSSRFATFLVTQDGGLYKTAPNANRMRNTSVATQFLPYDITFNPATATIRRNTDQPVAIRGTILAADFQSAYVGSYRDTVVLSVVP